VDVVSRLVWNGDWRLTGLDCCYGVMFVVRLFFDECWQYALTLQPELCSFVFRRESLLPSALQTLLTKVQPAEVIRVNGQSLARNKV
jgi:hypothetical protein